MRIPSQQKARYIYIQHPVEFCSGCEACTQKPTQQQREKFYQKSNQANVFAYYNINIM